MLANFIDRGIPVWGFLDRIARAFERLAQHRAEFDLILDEENGFHRYRGLAHPGSPPDLRRASSASAIACLSASICFFLASTSAVFLLMSSRVSCCSICFV